MASLGMGAEGRCLPGLMGWIAGSRTPASHRVTDQGTHGFDRCHYRLSPAAWARHPHKRKSPGKCRDLNKKPGLSTGYPEPPCRPVLPRACAVRISILPGNRCIRHVSWRRASPVNCKNSTQIQRYACGTGTSSTLMQCSISVIFTRACSASG